MLATAGDQMTFLERTGNFVSALIGSMVFAGFGAPLVENLRREVDPNFPSTDVGN